MFDQLKRSAQRPVLAVALAAGAAWAMPPEAPKPPRSRAGLAGTPSPKRPRLRGPAAGLSPYLALPPLPVAEEPNHGPNVWAADLLEPERPIRLAPQGVQPHPALAASLPPGPPFVPRLLEAALGAPLGPMACERLNVWGQRAALSARSRVDDRQFLVVLDLNGASGATQGPVLRHHLELPSRITGLRLLREPVLLCTLADGSYRCYERDTLALIGQGRTDHAPGRAGATDPSPLLLANPAQAEQLLALARGEAGVATWDLTRGSLGERPAWQAHSGVKLTSIHWPEPGRLTATGATGELLQFDPRTGRRPVSQFVPDPDLDLLTHAPGPDRWTLLGCEDHVLACADSRQPGTLVTTHWDPRVSAIRQVEPDAHGHGLLTAGESGFNYFAFAHVPLCGIVEGWVPPPSRHQPASAEVKFASADTFVVLYHHGLLSVNRLTRAPQDAGHDQVQGTTVTPGRTRPWSRYVPSRLGGS